ncbi:l- type ii [Fusarium langsethiae]|uniref:L-type ii n=1 Tax=Fusarium langsethiae TaxID=179993 RepID=A0A0M9ERR8_FUSLA|nr:l- type ii [Fusarium langsethiae]
MPLRFLSLFLSILLGLCVRAFRIDPLDSTSNQCSLDPKLHLPSVVVIAAGGTISGRGNFPTDTMHYTAGTIEIDTLLDKIRSDFKQDINVVSHQIFQLDSIDITLSHITLLHHTIDKYNSCPDIHGIVVLFGSSTALEVVTTLEHTLKLKKPVIFALAFKPPTAYNSEALGNLLASIRTAATIKINRVLILSNDLLFLPYETRKENNRFVPGPDSYVGDIVNFQPMIRHSQHYILKTFDISSIKPEQKFPAVEGFTAYIGFRGEIFERTQADAIVVESLDNGYWPTDSRMVLEELNVLVVATTGPTFLGVCGRIRGAVCANQWSHRSTIVLVAFLLASSLSREEITEFINNTFVE